ncbi:MAG: 4'-phosphopantetheinyl transferase superfamily protein [Clostridia bacterium]|nr:4'-phosphopantetheinyl transferase superfamily protein [Clostridia bacterium]
MIKLYLSDCTKATEHDDAQKLATYALRDTFGCELQILKDSRGKPYVSKNGVYLSIAHSHERCLVAVSDSEIGADIEYRSSEEDRLIRLAERFFTKEEAEYVKERPSERFYEIWCAKESYIKYTGEGLSCPLSSFCIFSLPLQFSHFNADDYTICVCSAQKTDTQPIYVK